MYTLNLRPIAFAVLLFAFLSVSGGTSAYAALSSADTAESCCFPAGQGEELPQAPCETSDCSCLFCLNLHLPRFADISFLPLSSAGPMCHPLSFPLTAFVRPIDYPPKHS
jgi:hypothetical protein